MFILAGPRPVPIRELVVRVAAAVGAPPPRVRLPLSVLLTAAKLCEAACRPIRIEPPPLHRRRCDFFHKPRAFSSAKARRMLGSAPRVDLDKGLPRTAEWYYAQGYLAKAKRGLPLLQGAARVCVAGGRPHHPVHPGAAMMMLLSCACG